MFLKPDRTRLHRIAEKYLPENVTTILIKNYRNSCTEYAGEGNIFIKHAPISSYQSLIAFLHECAHVKLQHKITGNIFGKIFYAAKTSEITEQDINEMATYLRNEKQAWDYTEKIVIQHRIPKFAWNYVLMRSRENTKKVLQGLCIIRGWERHKFDHLVEW
jgi:hypothetical protein